MTVVHYSNQLIFAGSYRVCVLAVDNSTEWSEGKKWTAIARCRFFAHCEQSDVTQETVVRMWHIVLTLSISIIYCKLNMDRHQREPDRWHRKKRSYRANRNTITTVENMIFVMKEMYNAYVKITDILSIIITLFHRITGSVSDISLSLNFRERKSLCKWNECFISSFTWLIFIYSRYICSLNRFRKKFHES